MKILFVLCIFCCLSFWEVYGGRPRLQDAEVTYYRPKRQFDSIVDDAVDPNKAAIEKRYDQTWRCAGGAGCHKGYCWAWCGFNLKGGDWCYTTKTYSQSFDYVPCTSDSECGYCWKCAGSCTL